MAIEFITANFAALDLIALLWFALLWSGYIYLTSRKGLSHNGLQQHLNHWREEWAFSLIKRSNRIMDSQILNSLIQKETFFASTTILILASSIALMGFREKANLMAQDIPFIEQSSAALWEIKVTVLAVIFVYAFFKFTWSIRQYSYSAILLGSIPEPGTTTEEVAREYALRLARLSSIGSGNFNDGIRAYYFALAELSWFINPIVFILVSSWVVAVLYRREYRSRSLKVLSSWQHKPD
jgi:uncharacterized membrane protein